MKYYLAQWVLSAASLFITAKIIPGFRLSGVFSALLAALLLGLANTIIWPVLFVLTLPITLVTLGLFVFVVNAAVLKICAALLPGFQIRGWLPAIFGWIVMSLVNLGLGYLFLSRPLVLV